MKFAYSLHAMLLYHCNINELCGLLHGLIDAVLSVTGDNGKNNDNVNNTKSKMNV